jgi:HAD superfamily phosphoserine phosphatase-like hydrolase
VTDVDLSAVSVFLDYDGTITVPGEILVEGHRVSVSADTGVHLLERLTTDDWRAVDREYASGAIGSREALSREWAMLPADEHTLRAVAREVPVDPGLGALVEGLRAAGAEVVVLSDGFGFHVAEALAPFGIEVLTNTVDFDTGVLEFPHVDRCCPCSTCGMCKQAPMKDARRRGRHAVFVGDGVSDRKAALLADRLFAKVGPHNEESGHSLAEWCELADVAYEPFESLADVHAALLI